MKILIVEDDIVSGSILSKILSKLSHDVDHGRDGMQAWEMYQTGNCRFVVSDWMMPKLDGIALCRRIRELNRNDYAYIIMITGKNAKEEFLSRIRAGQRILELQDVYGRASAKIAHREKSAAVGPLAAGIAHEINNPTGSELS